MRSVLSCVMCLGAASLLFAVSAGFRRTASHPKPSPIGVFAPDKGKFKVLLDGLLIGAEEFEIAPSGANWTARGTTEIKVPDGPAMRVSATLVAQPTGAPLSYEWTAQSDKKNGARVAFAGGVAKITLQMEGGVRPFEQTLTFDSPLIAVLDNNLYHHYAVLARLYDWPKGGEQAFPVFIPQELTPGTIKVQTTGSQSVDGKSYSGLSVKTTDLEVFLYLDKNHRLMRLDVPSAKVSVIRE